MYQSDEELLGAGETNNDHTNAMGAWMDQVSNLLINLSNKVETLEQRIQELEKKDFTPWQWR